MGLMVRFGELTSWLHMPAFADPIVKNKGVMARVPAIRRNRRRDMEVSPGFLILVIRSSGERRRYREVRAMILSHDCGGSPVKAKDYIRIVMKVSRGVFSIPAE
jgi:hypothetical protein